MRARRAIALSAIVALLVLGRFLTSRSIDPAPARGEVEARVPAATYVGSDACAPCHAAEVATWRRSHHARAMAAPTSTTVLGAFDGTTFVRGRALETLRFTRDGDRFVVESDIAGATTRHPVAYTFGVAPLQQVLLRGDRGRLQALTVAWDARPRAEGGERWYALDADAPAPPGDPFHSLGRMQNWNFTCSECHSTFVERRYDAAQDAFDTRFAEVSVGCEACHGPASRHLDDAARARPDRGLAHVLRGDHAWQPTTATGSPTPRDRRADAEVETCAPCHARRESITPSHHAGTPFLDSFRPTLPDAPYYFLDGRIRDEDFEWASFAQSRMFHAGVACSDCHEPHAGALRAEGDALCTRCHEEPRFATRTHRRHDARSPGGACVACHMPSRTYMGIDERRDHSLRVPSPALSASVGAPDGCTSCHSDRDVAWAESTLRATRADGARTWRDAYVAARRDRSASSLLAVFRDRSVPAIVRATALSSLSDPPAPELASAVREAAEDDDAVVRLAAATSAASLPFGPRAVAIASLLGDPRRAVRIEAARALADAPLERLAPAFRSRLEAAVEELLASERVNADRPEAWMRIALVERARGRLEAASAAYDEAKRRGPELVEVRVNLADLARERGDERAAERHLEDALSLAPHDASALHALGLLRIREGRLRDALPLLREATERRPDDAHLRFVLVLALHEAGERDAAERVLADGLSHAPGDPELESARRVLDP